MIHPHANWTRAALERYVGTTETLTLEFKSYRALVWGNHDERRKKISEAAKDVAAMANESGGYIIYGIEEAKNGARRRALRVEEGFEADQGISREWFLATMRAHIFPALPDLDAVDVELGGDRMALVALVPQSVGSARQTGDPKSGDLKCWRRDAQGLHNMTIQEINDVASRVTRPRLELRLPRTEATLEDVPGVERPRQQFRASIEFEITNDSLATADFAVITAALVLGIFVPPADEWVQMRSDKDWELRRTVLASGSSPRWSPITPGFVLAPQRFNVGVPLTTRGTVGSPSQTIGLIRLDHSGGARSYRLELPGVTGYGRGHPESLSRIDELGLGRPERPVTTEILLHPFPGDLLTRQIEELRAPAWFFVPPSVA